MISAQTIMIRYHSLAGLGMSERARIAAVAVLLGVTPEEVRDAVVTEIAGGG